MRFLLHEENQKRLFYSFLLVAVLTYSLYFLSFTLLDTFSTFSNDAASYVLVARKWSPYFPATAAELFTWPVHTFPPGFPFLLALTGASESLWAGHLAASICMLVGILLCGCWIGLQTDKLTAGALILALLFIPGVIIHSFGILSENLYLVLSLSALLVYQRLRQHASAAWPWYLLLVALLTGAVLTRTIGISLIGAILIAPLLDRHLPLRHRILFPALALVSLGLWQFYEAVQPYESELNYRYYLGSRFGTNPSSLISAPLSVFKEIPNHALHLSLAWNHYFFLNDERGSFFLAFYFSLLFSVIGLVLRSAQFRVDAIYVLFYIGVVLLWGFPDQMSRFLHPVGFILLAQPFIYFTEQGRLQQQGQMPKILLLLSVLLIAHFLVLQASLLRQRITAEKELPQIAHSFDYYGRLEGDRGALLALYYASLMDLMVKIGEVIPPDAVVAATKPEHFAIFANRKAVLLTAVVSHEQQLCNLYVTNTSAVFLSNLTSPLNMLGTKLKEAYESISYETYTFSNADATDVAYVLMIDRSKLDSALEDSGFNCQTYQEVE